MSEAVLCRTCREGRAAVRGRVPTAAMLPLQDTYERDGRLCNFYLDDRQFDRIRVTEQVGLFEDPWCHHLLAEIAARLCTGGEIVLSRGSPFRRAQRPSRTWLEAALDTPVERAGFGRWRLRVTGDGTRVYSQVDSQLPIYDRMVAVYRADDWLPLAAYAMARQAGGEVVHAHPLLGQLVERLDPDALFSLFPEDLPAGTTWTDVRRDWPALTSDATAADGNIDALADALREHTLAQRFPTQEQQHARDLRRLYTFTNRYGPLRQRSPVLKHVLRETVKGAGPLRLVEIGGSTANMTTELMLDGSTRLGSARIVEPRIEHAVKFARLAPLLPERVVTGTRYQLCSAEDGDFTGADVVLAVGTLLLLARETLGPLLERIAAQMRPGGVLIVHENMRVVDDDGGGPFNKLRFVATELDGYLRKVGSVRYFDATACRELKPCRVGERTVFRAVEIDRD